MFATPLHKNRAAELESRYRGIDIDIDMVALRRVNLSSGICTRIVDVTHVVCINKETTLLKFLVFTGF